jgi:WD40 repeat protein
VKTLAGHTCTVNSVVYSRNGKKILSASNDKTIKEWDVETGECLKTLVGHTLWVKSAVYSRDGKKILSASMDKTIKEWDVETGKCVKTLVEHTPWVDSVVYSRDGKKILSKSGEYFKEWDAETGECMHIWRYNDKPNLDEYEPEPREKENIIKISLKDLIDIPGLFIQGCGFKDLEPGSDISPKNLEILKQYGGRFGLKGE